ncbi:MAG: HAMP domain-containing histidine kinase [Proteobacteria bacterium]|nr:MAG: HAMP domain-containing histidine kinase [Pseudomonadota bacterium]
MGIIIFFYQGSLERSVEEIKLRRFARAQTARSAALSETLGKAAHEINNPLAILDGSLRRLKVSGSNQVAMDADKYIDFMKAALHRLQNIVTTIKAFSSAEMQGPSQMVLINDLIATLSEQVHETVNSFGIKFQIENECALASVSCRIQQILFTLNALVDNAIEASDEHKRQIDLIIRYQGDFIRFGIQNTARQLPLEYQERFFTPFFSTKPIGKSLGMNLSICRVLIEEHGGKIGFHRENDKTQLWFTLPFVGLSQV